MPKAWSGSRGRSAPAALDDRQWLRLVAVLVAPRRFDLFHSDPALDDRVARIQRLLASQCRPSGKRDVWLEGCRAPTAG